MILGGVTLEEVDEMYRVMNVKELFMLPWYEEDHKLVGLISGAIEHYEGWPGLSGFLEHFLVLPEAENRLQVLQQMPKEAARLLRARGIARILLCIEEAHPMRAGLDAWARRCGYTPYDYKEGRRWYIQPLT